MRANQHQRQRSNREAQPEAAADPPGMGTTRPCGHRRGSGRPRRGRRRRGIARRAGAANGTAVLLGGVNSAMATTVITTTAGAGLLGISSGFLNPGPSGAASPA